MSQTFASNECFPMVRTLIYLWTCFFENLEIPCDTLRYLEIP